MKHSPIDPKRAKICEPIAQNVKDYILRWVEDGTISLREAADVVEGLHFAFSTMVKIMKSHGGDERLDRIQPTDIPTED
jgi:hypothetical protein